MKQLIKNLLKAIHPRCQVCNDCATKLARCASPFILGGETYFCDNHTIDDIKGSKIKMNYTDLLHAEDIREASKYLDEI